MSLLMLAADGGGGSRGMGSRKRRMKVRRVRRFMADDGVGEGRGGGEGR